MPAVYESGGVSPAAGPDAGGAGGATSTPAQAYTAASHDPELANWVSGGSSTPTSSAPVQGAGGHVDSELGNWLSGGSSATAPADPQANQAGNQSSGWQNPLQAIGSLFSTMFSKPGQAIRSAAKAIEGDVQSGGKEFFTGVVPDAWRAAGRGFRGEENVSGRDLLPANAPTLFPAIHPLYGTPTGWGGAQKPVDWIYNHISKPVGGLGVELVSDPWMWSGAAGAKAIGGAAKAAGAFALGSPEALGAIEAFGGPAAQLLKTSKPILAGQSVLRNLAGQFSIDAALSHLPQGSEVTQAIREFMGGKSVGAVENEGRLAANLAPGLANATPEEKATFLYIKDSLAATEAQAKVARETAATAEEAQKQAVLNYKAPGPFDGSADIANQAGLAQRAGAALPGPEFSAIQNVAQGAGQTPEEALQDIAKRAYGHAPDVALNPGQRGQIVRAFGNAQNLDEGYTNLADLIRSEGTHGPGEFGTAVRNKAAMDPAGADPFNMSLEQRHQSATDDLANLVREHKWNSDKYDFNVNQLARGAAKDINLANGDARNQLWQEILSHGKIRPGSGSAGAELTRGLPSFLKDAKGGMGLDELASSMRGGMTEQQLVNEIMGVSGKQPVTATSSQAIKEAEQRFLSTPEGQKLRDTLSAHSQQMDALREELGPLQQALSAKRGPFDDLPAGEFPRPSWSQIEAPATTTGGQLAAQGAGQTTGPVDVEKAVLQAVQNRKSTLLTVELVDGSQMDLHFMAPYDSARHELIDHAGNAVDPKLVRKLIDRGTGQVLVDATAPAATSFASGGLSEAANAVVQDALRNNGGDKAAAVTDLLEHLKAMGKMTGDPEIPAQMNTWREAVTHLGGTPPAETPQLTADHLRQWLDNPQNLDQAATRNMEAYGWKDKPGSPFWTKERDGIEHILRNEVLPGVEAGNTQAWRVRLGPGGSVGDMVGESLASQAKGAAGAGAQATSGINPNAIPEQYRHLVEPVMQKYGHLLPEFQKLTDESYAKARGFLPDLGYQEHYVPRISRAGAADANPLTKLYNRLTEDAAAIPTKEGQMAGALSTKPGFANERTLPTFDAFARDAASRGRHAVLDPVDALLTHMNQSTHAEQSMKLRDELLSMGDGIAVKFENYRDIPPGFKDMSNVPGWDKIAVEKKVGKVLEDVLLPKERGPAGILYDTMADRIKGATFYNPLVHGKNLGYRAVMEGQNPLLSAATRAEVKEFGPTLRNLIEHGGATEYRPAGAEAANALYRQARLADGTATATEKLRNVGAKLHDSLWNYDKGLRVAMAQDLQKQGMDWPEIARRVNQAYGKPLDPTAANALLKRFSFTPSWTANNLAWDARNILNPRVRALTTALDSVNRQNTGHNREDNIPGKQEYTAIGPPGADNKQPFLNLSTPDKDLRELVRNPLDFLWQRGAPIPRTAGGMLLGNSRPFDPTRGLDYNKPGSGGPLLGYSSSGYGPDVSLRTQAAASQMLPLAGGIYGQLLSEGANVGRSANPLRDLALRMGGMYASDVNEPLSKALDFRQQVKDQKAGIRAQTLRKWKRQNGK